LHAKVSPKGLRFFSHDAAQSDCPTAGESLAHRLLKLELVSAVRAAGWEAELEVAGNGWRADVLATSPERRRVAWEAQLAQITTEEISDRHSTMIADGLEVCWVTDRHRAWIGEVPAIAVVPAHPETGETGLHVVAGHARFEAHWCQNRRSCHDVPDFERYAQQAGPCPGHGRWETPPPLPVTRFVAAVCADCLRCLTLTEHHRDAWQRQGAPASAWTSRRSVVAEHEQVAAGKVREAFEQGLDAESASHERHIVALMERQQAIRKPAAALVGELTGAGMAGRRRPGTGVGHGHPRAGRLAGRRRSHLPRGLAHRAQRAGPPGAAGDPRGQPGRGRPHCQGCEARPAHRGADRQNTFTPTDSPSPGRRLEDAAFDQPTHAGGMKPEGRRIQGYRPTAAHAAERIYGETEAVQARASIPAPGPAPGSEPEYEDLSRAWNDLIDGLPLIDGWTINDPPANIDERGQSYIGPYLRFVSRRSASTSSRLQPSVTSPPTGSSEPRSTPRRASGCRSGGRR
jgi:hypothetical protein